MNFRRGTHKLNLCLLYKLSCSFSADSYNSLSPLDGRYAKSTEQLRKFFSESALMKYRVKV